MFPLTLLLGALYVCFLLFALGLCQAAARRDLGGECAALRRRVGSTRRRSAVRPQKGGPASAPFRVVISVGPGSAQLASRTARQELGGDPS
jgi:hypothetical protein